MRATEFIPTNNALSEANNPTPASAPKNIRHSDSLAPKVLLSALRILTIDT
ncbi:MAG TPA: hypothetical protein IAA23_02045 [Candidatus Helicobacter avistercoris]|nr:hypothetical protein [Candidatus Helicobacter avistercoris]